MSFGVKLVPDLGEQIDHLIGLHGEEQDIRGGHHVGIAGGDAGSGFPGEGVASGFEDVRGAQVVGGGESGAEKAFGQRGGHLARAEKTKMKSRHVEKVVPASGPSAKGK